MNLLWGYHMCSSGEEWSMWEFSVLTEIVSFVVESPDNSNWVEWLKFSSELNWTMEFDNGFFDVDMELADLNKKFRENNSRLWRM